MMKAMLREIKLLRREVKENRCKSSGGDSCERGPKSNIKLNIPANSIQEFKTLELEIKLDIDKENLLVGLFLIFQVYFY